MRNILIIDDHAVVREGIKDILKEEILNPTFGEAGNSGEALDLIRQKEWDVVILDISLPGRSGLDLLQEIKQINPKLPVLVYSMHAEDEFAIRAIRSGASCFLSKSDVPEQLVKAIHQLISGRKYITEKLAERLASELDDWTEKPSHERLSNREYQIMIMLASGKPTGSIANELSLSAKTISTYRARILEKMKMKSNADIIHYVIEHKLT
ncbi:MAG: response regulator transcription factor [Ignavibacteriales bacterium]|nr:response regulator transcription factor [Ignavibacteriales bacterium]